MAERRMFTKKITDSDAFIELSSAAQALYFHLNQGADDDGFNNQIQNAMFKAHASTDDLKILLAKNFVIRFESGVLVIKHWRMHNTLRKDRYTPTNFQEELNQLGLKDNGAYTLGCHVVAKRLPQDSIGKESIVKESIGEESIEADETSAPSLEDIITYVSENNLNVNAQKFYEYYDRTGWQTTKGNTFDWKAKVKEWSTSERPTTPKNTTKSSNPFYDLLKNGETYE